MRTVRHLRGGAVGCAAVLLMSTTVSAGDDPAGMIAADGPGLNHIYVVVDRETFAAMRDDARLVGVLGRTDGGLPDYASPPADADRIFFRGRTTYLEVFAPENRFREPVGKVGVALAADDHNAFARIRSAWQAHCGPRFRIDVVAWRRSQPPVPWYEALHCDDTAGGPHLALWAMVYRPEFVGWQTRTDPARTTAVSREAVLAPRRAGGQGRFDVTAVAIDVVGSQHELLVAQLESAGLLRTDAADGTRFTGEGWHLLLRRVAKDPGLVSMTLDVAAGDPLGLDLGSARLTRDQESAAILRFGSLRAGAATSARPAQ